MISEESVDEPYSTNDLVGNGLDRDGEHLEESDFSELFSDLRLLILAGKKKSLRVVLNHNPEVLCESDAFGRGLLIYSVICNRHEITKILLKFGADAAHRDKHGRSALHWACLKGGSSCAKSLITYGAKVMIQDNDGVTPVHLAVCPVATTCLSLILANLPKEHHLIDDVMGRSPAHWAATLGQYNHLMMLLKQPSQSVDMRDKMGRTVLICALNSSKPGAQDTVKILLKEASWVITEPDINGYSPLHLAVAAQNTAMAQLLMEYPNCNVNSLDNEFRTPLHWAACFGAVYLVRVLIEKGATLVRDRAGATPLHYAAMNNDVATVMMLILYAKQTDDLLDTAGRSSLMWAAVGGADDTIRLLLQRFPSADPSQRDHNGSTALHLASTAGRESTVELLLERDWFIGATDNQSRTPLLIAAEHGKADVCQTLIGRGADVFAVDLNGRTALHWACLGGNALACQIVLQHGLSANTPDNGGRTPVHCAAFGGFVNCLSIMARSEAEVDSLDHEGYSPMHLAAKEGHLDAVKCLLEYDSPVNPILFIDTNETPLDLAISGCHQDVVDLLTLNGGMTIEKLREVAAIKIQKCFRLYSVRKRRSCR